MKKIIFASAIVLASLLSSCGDTSYCYELTATVTIDGQKFKNVTFPYTTKIRRGFDETIVKVEAPTYDTETIVINKNFNAVSVINLFDVLGWGIDAATGAITKPEFKFYEVNLTPKK